MTFVPVNFDEAVEPSPVSSGRYDVQITAAKVVQTGPNSNHPGRDQILVSLGFTGDSKEEQNAPNISHYISLPHPDDEAKSANFKTLLLKRFLVAFNIPFDSNGIDLDQICFAMIGATASMEVGLSEPNDNGNVYNRLVLPRIKEETGRFNPPQ